MNLIKKKDSSNGKNVQKSERILKFNGLNSKSAKCIKIDLETKLNDVLDHLYNSIGDGWNLQRPNLILSVTGGAQNFTIPQRMKQAFKIGLIKAAATTGAW